MEVPVQVSFRHVPYDEAVAADIRARAVRLLKFQGRILNCHVAVEQPHHGHQHGNRYHVRIELAVPGELLIIVHEPAPVPPRNGDEPDARQHKADEAAPHRRDITVTVHEAFDEARRRLEDYVRRRRAFTRPPEPSPAADAEGDAEWPSPPYAVSSRVH